MGGERDGRWDGLVLVVYGGGVMGAPFFGVLVHVCIGVSYAFVGGWYWLSSAGGDLVAMQEGRVTVATRGCGRGVSGLGRSWTQTVGAVVVVARDGKPGGGTQHWWQDGMGGCVMLWHGPGGSEKGGG